MDYHDGKYGVNTSPSRGADTFVPFRSSGKVGSFTVTNSNKQQTFSGSKIVEGTVLAAGVSSVSGSYQGTNLNISWEDNKISYSFNCNNHLGYGPVTLTIYYCYI